MKYLALFLLTFLAMFPTNAQWTVNGNSITTTDNVGIGTSSPNASLEVTDEIRVRLATNFINKNVARIMPLGYSGITGAMNWTLRGAYQYSNGINNNSDGGDLDIIKSLDRNTILATKTDGTPLGNVGIGTINPIYAKVQIRGGATHQLLALNRPNNDVPALYLGNDGSNNAVIAANNSDLTFGKDLSGSYTEHMRIQNSGNVGIGTTDPDGWKLAVNGNIRAKEIKVETGWSDFVFYDDYKLPTLQEVENHIKEKGHLKDIPSATEVQKNGVFLGEMDAKLLQKIEELTLYTIQQQKEIQSLKKENGELKSISTRLAEIEKLIELKN